MTSPTSVTASQFQNYSIGSQFATSSSTNSLPNLQTALNSTTSPGGATGANSVTSSMGGTSNTSPLTSYTIKNPSQTSSYTFLNKNSMAKPSMTGVFSPSSLNRNNLLTASTYTGTQAPYSTHSGSNNPPQTNFWRKN